MYAENESHAFLSFENDGELQLNKGFNLYLLGESDNNTKVSALRLDITFDNSELKFLDCNSTQNEEGMIVKASLTSENTIRIIYINNNGAELSDDAKRLVNIRFKPIKKISGQQYSFKVHILEVGNSNAEAINASYSSEFILATPSASGDTAKIISKSKSETSSYSSSSKSGSKVESKSKSNSERSNNSKKAANNSRTKETSDSLDGDQTDATLTEKDIDIVSRNHDNIFSNPFFCVIFGAIIVVSVIMIYKAINSDKSSKHAGKYESKD